MRQSRSLRHVFFCILLLGVFCTTFPDRALAQKLSFGVVTGAQLTDDFRTQDFNYGTGDIGDGVTRTVTRSVANASKLLIVGPRLDISFGDSFSVGLEALHRSIRTRSRNHVSPPFVLPDGTSRDFYSDNTGTEFTWEFPVLAKYRLNGLSLKPFVEAGPSFRPAENRELYGLTAGAGVTLRVGEFNFSPTLRYSNWLRTQRYPGAAPNQLQFLVGIQQASGSSGVNAFGKRISMGGVVGWALTRDIRTKSTASAQTLSVQFSDSTSPLVGMTLEAELGKNFSIEMDGLYRPLHFREVSAIPAELRCYYAGCEGQGNVSNTIVTWQFPVLAKYRLPDTRLNPFVQLGPSFRASGNLNGSNPSRYGITVGLGVETTLGRVKIAPSVRYTHWADDKARPFSPITLPNQVETMIGVSF